MEMKIWKNRWQNIGIIALVACSCGAYAANNSSKDEAEARIKYEQQKEQLTHASDYIDKAGEPRSTLLQSTPKTDDALSLKGKKNED